MARVSDVFCDSCGKRMVEVQHRAVLRCEDCDEERTRFQVVERPPITCVRGTHCVMCDGTGEDEVEVQERHPYGETFAVEHLVEIEDCPDCDGKGYFLDEEHCVVCNEPLTEPGHLLGGWEVHERCLGERVPKLVGWDGD